jgi:hypothetical protein
MKFRFISLAAAIVFAALGAFATTACSSKSVAAAANQDSLADVIYEGTGSDEALTDMLLAKKASGKTPRITFPAANQSIASATLPTFAWAEPTAAYRVPRPELQWLPAFDEARQATRTNRVPRLLDWLQIEGTAYAHGSASNGVGYLVEFSTPAAPKYLRIFTTKTSYVPLGDAWQRLQAAKTGIRMKITAATFEENRLVAGSGPFESEAVTFTIAGI